MVLLILFVSVITIVVYGTMYTIYKHSCIETLSLEIKYLTLEKEALIKKVYSLKEEIEKLKKENIKIKEKIGYNPFKAKK